MTHCLCQIRALASTSHCPPSGRNWELLHGHEAHSVTCTLLDIVCRQHTGLMPASNLATLTHPRNTQV